MHQNDAPPAPFAIALEKKIREYALGFPEVHEEFPWGERAIKVRGKTFVFLRAGSDSLSFSMKLPQSKDFALDLPFTEATGYGLGKSGWVTARFTRETKFPVDVIRDWVRESYRAVAPKKLVKLLDAGVPVD